MRGFDNIEDWTEVVDSNHWSWGAVARPESKTFVFRVSSKLLIGNPGPAMCFIQDRIHRMLEKIAWRDFENAARRIHAADMGVLISDMAMHLTSLSDFYFGVRAWRQIHHQTRKSTQRLVNLRRSSCCEHIPNMDDVYLINSEQVTWCLWKDPAPSLTLVSGGDEHTVLRFEMHAGVATESSDSILRGVRK